MTLEAVDVPWSRLTRDVKDALVSGDAWIETITPHEEEKFSLDRDTSWIEYFDVLDIVWMRDRRRWLVIMQVPKAKTVTVCGGPERPRPDLGFPSMDLIVSSGYLIEVAEEPVEIGPVDGGVTGRFR